jgi:nitrate reductase gamma subunit
MEMRFLVGVILPYVALAVFVVGMAYRIYTWRKLAAPPMTLFPAPPDDRSTTVNTIQEVVLFRSLFKGDRLLWILAWIFHAVLLLIFIGHFRVFANVDALLMKMGMSEDAIQAMSSGAGGAAGVVILLATILLLVRRMAVPRVRQITGAADYLALALIGLIIVTGNMMRFPVVPAKAHVSASPAAGALPESSEPEHFDLTVTRKYFGALATFSFSDVRPIKEALKHNVFFVHMCLAFVLIICMPFSKLLHFGGIFFTHQLIRKQ